MAQPPDLKIPPSDSKVDVRIINTTSDVAGISLEGFVTPQIPGFFTLSCPVYAFLIEHPSGRKILFDLGVRKDWQNLAPRVYNMIKDFGWKVAVEKGVREQLEEHGINGKDIEAIIWSHWHWDHIGDPSTFDSHTALVVGPGFKEKLTPAYPANKDSPITEDAYTGRELREISFEDNGGLKIGNFKAFDYFDDGSFYILDSPGHAVGHICGLARVTASPSSFIFMGGDAAHHCGEFRPSEYLPLPSSISPNPLDFKSNKPCPGELFEHLLRDGDATKPFYAVADLPDGKGVAVDAAEAQRTIGKVMEADAREEILVAMAHDDTLLPVVDFFPKYANGFAEKGWVQEARWTFLKDFEKAAKKVT